MSQQSSRSNLAPWLILVAIAFAIFVTVAMVFTINQVNNLVDDQRALEQQVAASEPPVVTPVESPWASAAEVDALIERLIAQEEDLAQYSEAVKDLTTDEQFEGFAPGGLFPGMTGMPPIGENELLPFLMLMGLLESGIFDPGIDPWDNDYGCECLPYPSYDYDYDESESDTLPYDDDDPDMLYEGEWEEDDYSTPG